MGILTLAAVVGVLFASGTFLILRRSPIKLILGLGLLSHGVNLLLFSTGGLARGTPPIIVDKSNFDGVIDGFVDPLPQALILTAIVISFGVTAFTVVLVRRRHSLAETIQPDVLGVQSRKAVDPFLADEQAAWKGLDTDPDDYEWLEYSLRDDDRWQRAQAKLAQQKEAEEERAAAEPEEENSENAVDSTQPDPTSNIDPADLDSTGGAA